MLKMTSRSRTVIGAIFAMNGILYAVTGKWLLAGTWFFCAAVHFIEAYRLHCREKEEI